MSRLGIFGEIKIKIDKDNCLIHKPLCECCKKRYNLWKIAKKVIKINNKYYSLCIDCFEEISNGYKNKKRNVS